MGRGGEEEPEGIGPSELEEEFSGSFGPYVGLTSPVTLRARSNAQQVGFEVLVPCRLELAAAASHIRISIQ